MNRSIYRSEGGCASVSMPGPIGALLAGLWGLSFLRRRGPAPPA